jgi:hypothetical protein
VVTEYVSRKTLNHLSISPSIFYSRRNLGSNFELPRLGSMACDAGNCVCSVAYRLSTTLKADDRVRMLQFEQYAVGDLGGVRRGLCAHRLAGFPFPNEPSRIQEEPRCKLGLSVKQALSDLKPSLWRHASGSPVAVKILLKTRTFMPRSTHSSIINVWAFA